MLLMAPLGGEISRGIITWKALMDSTIPGAPAGALLFRGRGSQGAGRVTSGNVTWVPAIHLGARRSTANIWFSLDALLEQPLAPAFPAGLGPDNLIQAVWEWETR